LCLCVQLKMNKLVLLVSIAIVVCVSAHDIHKAARDDDVVYTPNPLPCSVTFIEKRSRTNLTSGEVRVNETVSYYLHDKYFHLKIVGTDNRGYRALQILAVPNKNNQSLSDIEYCDDDGCEEETEELDLDSIFSHWGFLLGENSSFDSKESGKFQGKDCTIFTTHKWILYVGSDNIPIASKYNDLPEDIEDISLYEYQPYAPLDSFVIDKKLFPNCSEKWYKPPTEAMCPEPSSSIASVIRITFGLIVMCVVTIIASVF